MKNYITPFEAKRFFSGMLWFFLLLLCLGGIGTVFEYLSGTTQFVTPQAPAIEGQKGYLLSDMVACPKLDDLKTTLKTMIASAKVKDVVGFNDDLTQAIDEGCRSLKSGASGLVINRVGYYAGYTEIRMDDDENSYWIDNQYVGTMLAPNWDFRRLFWGVSTRIRSALM